MILVIVLSYGFLLTNQSIGTDDENFDFYYKMKEDSLYFRYFFESVDKFWEKGRGAGNFCGNSSKFFMEKTDKKWYTILICVN